MFSTRSIFGGPSYDKPCEDKDDVSISGQLEVDSGWNPDLDQVWFDDKGHRKALEDLYI